MVSNLQKKEYGWGTAGAYALNYFLFALFFLILHGWERLRSNRSEGQG